jgi:hypothetical protein
MPDGLATHGEVLNACYDAYAMELGRMEMKSNYGTTHEYIPQLMDLYKEKHGLTFNEEYTPAPAKPFRNPPGFNKQGTGVGNKLAQQTRKEWEEKKKKEQGVAEGEDKYAELKQKIRDLSQSGNEREAHKQRYELNRLLLLDRDREARGVAESYWTKLQNERNTKINSLINELKESIK